MAGINCIITDDFKIMANRMILAFKGDDKEDFKTSGKYILKKIEQKREYDFFLEYLYEKIKNEVV